MLSLCYLSWHWFVTEEFLKVWKAGHGAAQVKGVELQEHRLWHSTVPVPPGKALDFPPLLSDGGYGFHSFASS